MADQICSGILEMNKKGFGFLRVDLKTLNQNPKDVHVNQDLVRKFNLQQGVLITGTTRPDNRGGETLAKIDTICGKPAAEYPRSVCAFDRLTSINPDQKIRFETVPEKTTTRAVDLLCPVGKGQRGLIVAPPRTGKTVLLQDMANGVAKNHPDMKLLVLLVDERPEEVTDMRRSINGSVYASTSDYDYVSHIRLANLVIDICKRLVEVGDDVILFMDSITRLGRAFNQNTASSGKTLSGGIDSNALAQPKKIFGSARCAEEGGSLTIIATALIDTGSRMDEYIFQEFKGTGNMELVLDRKMADRRIYPALDIMQSGTRKEELLMSEAELKKITDLRRQFSRVDPTSAMEMLLKIFSAHPTNQEIINKEL